MCSPRRPPLSAPERSRAGFTLVELILALVLTGLVATAVYRSTSFAGRFVARQAAQEEVQQNLRASLDLIAGELRSVVPQGIVRMTPDSIRFFLPRLWGISCSDVSAQDGVLWAIFPARVLQSPSFFGSAHWGVALLEPGDSGAPAAWRFVRSPSRRMEGNPCAELQPELSEAAHVTYGFVPPAGEAFAALSPVPAGSSVLVFEEMKYDVSPSAAPLIRGAWLRRMVGRTAAGANMQPMAGPVGVGDGLRFRYFGLDGSPTDVPELVRRVEVRVIGVSRQETGPATARRPLHVDTGSVEVFLRNAEPW